MPGILLLWHMVGHGPAVLAAGAGRMGWVFLLVFFLSRLSYLPFLMPRLLVPAGVNRYNPKVGVSYCRMRLVNHLVGLNLSRNSVNGYLLAGSTLTGP